jgi:S1-C subfamily serine protease
MNIVRKLHRRVVFLVAVGLVGASVVAALAFARSAAKPVGTGVVVINTKLSYEGGSAAGTGMVLTSSGEVLTNNHVISGATSITVVVPNTGRTYTARVVGYDRTADVAVLQLQGASNLKTVATTSTKLSIGATVTALGNAGGSGSITSATGKVTGLGKTITASDGAGSSEQLNGLIETNAGVQPGDSGGPLVNSKGQVVGMDTAASATSQFGFRQMSTPDAYAIPIAKAITVASAITSGKASATVHIGSTPFLGVEVGPAGYGGSGAVIAGVVPGGPAARAGLTAGDVITAIDGRTISSPSVIPSIVLAKKPGARITVVYVDQFGVSHTATVTLGSGPPQ